MMIPVQSIIIPEYVNIANVGLVNQFLGPILVYAALGIPFATYLMTTYFRGLPDELIEASLVDGATYWPDLPDGHDAAGDPGGRRPWPSCSSSRSGATC